MSPGTSFSACYLWDVTLCFKRGVTKDIVVLALNHDHALFTAVRAHQEKFPEENIIATRGAVRRRESAFFETDFGTGCDPLGFRLD